MNQLINVYDVEEGGIANAVFLQRALDRALRFRTFGSWITDTRALEVLVEALDAVVVHANRREDFDGVVIEVGDAIAYAWMRIEGDAQPDFSIDVFGGTHHAARDMVARAKEVIAPARQLEPGRISVAFWYSSKGCGTKVMRTLEAPAWREASANYPSRTRASLQPLITDPRGVIAKGRLVLWHGPPGTGKTSALRTLARENPGVISLEYVLDPEAMFGREASYFMEVIFDDDDDASSGTRLLVLEDCDELLSADAKDRSGQGLARLLNLVDGFIGQGLDIAVLITTNEPLAAFHPAVTRPGRCGAVIEFEAFDPAEAGAWLAAAGKEGGAASRRTLAELIAGRDPEVRPAVREKIGFLARR